MGEGGMGPSVRTTEAKIDLKCILNACSCFFEWTVLLIIVLVYEYVYIVGKGMPESPKCQATIGPR